MIVEWNALSRAEWDRAAADAGAALQQDWGYGAAMTALGGRAMRAAVRPAPGAPPIALAQILMRDLAYGLARFALCNRGPVWLAPDLGAAEKAACLRALRQAVPARRPRLTLFSPEEEGRPDWLAAAGLRRVMTGWSTVMLDLRQDAAELRAQMHGKWRNRLAAAEKAGLRAARGGAKPAQYRWLLSREEAQAARRGYQGLPTAFPEAYQAARGDRGAVRVFRAEDGREPAAAMMFLIHGRAATYHIGWSSDAGRKRSAHNLTLWRAVEALKADGIERLDLGGVNTESGAGLARFKLGAGGRCVTLCGAYA